MCPSSTWSRCRLTFPQAGNCNRLSTTGTRSRLPSKLLRYVRRQMAVRTGKGNGLGSRWLRGRAGSTHAKTQVIFAIAAETWIKRPGRLLDGKGILPQRRFHGRRSLCRTEPQWVGWSVPCRKGRTLGGSRSTGVESAERKLDS